MFQSCKDIALSARKYKPFLHCIESQFIRSFKRDDIHKCCTLISDEPTCLITTSSHVPKRRYSTQARKYKPLLHCTGSPKRNDIKTFYS